MGRHSEFSHEIADEICHRVSGGASVKTICASEGMPSMQTVFKWLREQSSFAENYTRATMERADAVFEEMFAIADDGSNDTYVDEKGFVKVDTDVVNRSRLRIETRKWALARMAPKKYGDKIETVHSGTIDVMTKEQRDAAVAAAALANS